MMIARGTEFRARRVFEQTTSRKRDGEPPNRLGPISTKRLAACGVIAVTEAATNLLK